MSSVSQCARMNKKDICCTVNLSNRKTIHHFKIIVIFTIELITFSGLIYESQYHSYTKDCIIISILDFKLLTIQILYIFAIRSLIKFNTNYYHQYLYYGLIFIGILFVSFPGIHEEVNLEFKYLLIAAYTF